MRNIALTLMYDGTAYHGWQVQKRDVTVAETLEKALSTVVCHPVKCTGAGRTDAGVHAEVYVANFRTTSTIPCDRIPLAVNTRLRQLRYQGRDWFVLGLFVAIAVLVGVLGRMGL